MNLSRAISSIILQYGLYNVNLPFNDSIENVIHNILSTETIPIYSEFVPWERAATVNLAYMKLLDKHMNIYQLPEELTSTPVKYVISVKPPFEVNRGIYGDVSVPFGVARSIQGVLANQAYSMVVGQARAEPTFEYLGENKIRLYGFPKTWTTIKVAAEHDPNGESIPSGCTDSFMQLAKLDVRISLYNTLKLYDGIASAFGTISLKTEDHQGAESERNTLLEEWRNTFHLDMDIWEFM